ncbi:hypothetical protein N0V92_001930 [Colletotrichum tropicale]|nr:hypothetical protein N0V92_001930 [Colletotrichum tropicale]
MSWRSLDDMKHITQGVDVVNPEYKHPQLVIVNDAFVLPNTLATQFTTLFMKGKLFSGKDPTQPRPSDEDEQALFCQPYREWAPAPYNNPRIRVDNALSRTISIIGGMGDLLSIVMTTSTECDRDLHHMKTRLLHGLPPMSLARWRQKGLHELANFERACEHLSQVVDAFEYINLPQTQDRMRKAANGVWDTCSDFERALNAYRAERGRTSISVTAMWEEFLVDYLTTVAERAHAWTLARLDELREVQWARLQGIVSMPIQTLMPMQLEILDKVHDLTELTNKVDTRIMLPLPGFRLQTLTAAIPRIRDNWEGYQGGTPMTAFPYNMRFRSKVYALRCKWLTNQAMVLYTMRKGADVRQRGDPVRSEETSRLQAHAYVTARRELRGPSQAISGDEPWICEVKNMMNLGNRSLRTWGFVGYRICYEHSDEEWKTFLEKFKSDVTAWGDGVRGAGDVKPLCKVRWLDGREHGIPEGDVEAAKRHYQEYSKSPAMAMFLPTGPDSVFLAADKASIESYLHPIQDNAGPIIPVPLEGFSYTQGQPKKFKQDNGVIREFCDTCGAFVCEYGEAAADKFRYVMWGTFDEPDKVPPKGEFFCAQREAWMPEIDAHFDMKMGQTETRPEPGLRQRSRTALLIVACALTLYAGVVQILTLIAGTWVTRGCDGVQRLGLSSLSILKFDGIIPSPLDPGSYDLTMHLFLSSFGYEYPNASTAAFATAEPNLPYDFIQIGEQLGVDPSSWACLRSTDQCTSPFFNTFRHDSFEMIRTLEYASHILAIAYIALLFITELLIVTRPSWLRCQCYFSALKRVCPCPRGSRAQIEALPSGFWDRYRAWVWLTLPAFAFLPAFGLVMKGLLLKSYVNRPGAGEVNARFGERFVVAEGTAVGAACLAVVCVYVRASLGKKVNWMEQQGGVSDEETKIAVVGLLSRGFTDAEPEVPLSSEPYGLHCDREPADEKDKDDDEEQPLRYM